MKRVSILVALLAATLPATTMAGPPDGHKFAKHKHHEERSRDKDRRDDDWRRDYRRDDDDHDHDSDRDRDREALLRYFGYDGKHDGKDNPGRGWGVGSVPPGHMMKYRPGMRLGPDDYVIIRDLDHYRLPRLDRDSMYVRRDDQIYRMNRDTQTVIEAIGIVKDLLR